MKAETIAQILAQHVDRGAEFGPGELVTVICLCGAETSANDHRGINRHLAVEEVLARHQAEVLWSAYREDDPGQSSEWGTDHWGEIMSELTERRARSVSIVSGASLYRRAPHGEWMSVDEHAAKVDRAVNDPRRIQRRKQLAPAMLVPRNRGKKQKKEFRARIAHWLGIHAPSRCLSGDCPTRKCSNRA